MRKLLALIVGLALFATPALAGWNIRQNADGTADWVNTKGDVSPIGAIYLNATITDIATAQTIAIPIPVTAVKVTLVQSSIDGDITTADAVVDFWRASSTGAVVEEVSKASASSGLTITAISGAETGDVDTFSPDNGNRFEQNQVLYIHADGGPTSTGTIAVHFTITLQPYR